MRDKPITELAQHSPVIELELSQLGLRRREVPRLNMPPGRINQDTTDALMVEQMQPPKPIA